MEQKTTKTMKERLSEKWRTFRQWQQKPYEVAPLSEVHHKCATCGTEYQGNYCPRCGQSSKIGRYSFKNAFLLFLDVWGLGNRGMFRTLRDLILRPGYMIRDYLSGMQMAYFPPFKLFFLLTALSLVVEGGINLKGKNYFEEARIVMNNYLEEAKAESVTAEEKEADKTVREYSNKFLTLQQRFPNISTLAFLVIMSGFLYIFFRRSPAIPGLRYSEFLVSQVYITDMFSIYNIVLEFLCFNINLNYITFLLPLIPLKQMSGFPWWKVIVFTLLAGMMLFIPFFIIGIISMFVIVH
ncbi:MAG: DUF3667 domain-containing protein [Prevotella sp.]|nr:DUF3667 domain-containing protein [Prevotella sp.]